MDFNQASPGAVPFAITDPELIPTKRYYDADFFDLEADRLWNHVWQMACRLEQIQNVGDWIEYSLLGKSVIVVRTADGVKAFHNHCRHRGVPLTGGKDGAHGNCKTQGFICPFHGWRWNMNGVNTFVYGRHLFSPDKLEKSDLALRPCRVETWGGCAFINFDDAAPSFRDSIGPVTDRLEAHGMSNLRAEWWFATVLPANWKIAAEAFMEGYHVMRTHPQLHQMVPELYNVTYGNDTGAGVAANPHLSVRDNIKAQFKHMELLCSGMGGMIHAKEVEIARGLLDIDLPEDPVLAVQTWYGTLQAAITEQLRATGEPVPDLNAVSQSDPVNPVQYIFPHYFLLPFFTSMSSYRIRPLGPESCLFELWSLTGYPKGQEPSPPMEPTFLPYDSQDFPAIPRQDYSNIPAQQKGLHSVGNEHLRLSKQTEGLVSNYQRLIDGFLARLDPAKLAAATQKLGGNFDGPILDLRL